MKKVTIEVFIGRAYETWIGGWIKLPLSEKDLDEKIEKLVGKDKDYIICDFENEYQDIIYISDFSSVKELNRFLNHLNELDEEQRLLEMSLYSYFGENLEDINIALKNLDCFDFYSGIKDGEEETIGEVLVEKGYIGHVRDDLKEWLDYEKIGRNAYCDGFVYIESIHTIIRQKQGFN